MPQNKKPKREFFFEPYRAEFKPSGPGSIVVVFGDGDSRHRGVEVAMHEDGLATVWVPTGGRTFWCPSLGNEDNPNEPWETRLQEFDTQTGEIVRD